MARKERITKNEEIAISYLSSVVRSDAQLCRTDFQPTVGTNPNGL